MRFNSVRHAVAIAAISFIFVPALVIAQDNVAWFNGLDHGDERNGFRAESVYLTDAGVPMGGRFIHTASGFTLDVLTIQSVPQAFVWVRSFPTSDMGEPHTQEHLLLGKGNRGRAVAALEDMSLASSSAFTRQLETCYHFSTAGGEATFFTLFEAQLDALLHPDYTDEEIRREVRNFGVAVDPDGGTLRLEEKGTVYNEMTSSFERPWSRLFRAVGHLLYGEEHPQSYSSGGLPEAIRRMQPEDIRRFHHDHYHLPNMGMVVSMPNDVSVESILSRTDAILNRVQPKDEIAGRTAQTYDDLPLPTPAPEGTIRVVSYPQQNAQQPGNVILAWPAQLDLDQRERLIAAMFLQNFSGDPSTPLYKTFVDTRTRTVDIDAKSVFGWMDNEPGNAVFIGVGDVPPTHMDDRTLKLIRDTVIAHIRHVANLKYGSQELEEFNTMLRSRLKETRRDMSKFVGSPPGFGSRGTGANWMVHLEDIATMPGFRKYVTQRDDLDALEKLLSEKRNVWADLIREWKLLESTPYIVAVRPDPELVAAEANERRERIAAEVEELKKRYSTDDDQAAIRRYSADYDAATAQLDAALESVETPPFISNPPMTLDDQLDYEVTTVAGRVPLVASRFDNMTGATVGLAVRMEGVPRNRYHYVALLPALMGQVGVVDNGTPISYDEMSERMRNEILGLNASYSSNHTTGRLELVLRASGNDPAETRRALEWMQLVMFSPDWRVENLPRIRDVVDQTLTSLRSTMQGREEAWVSNPAGAWRRQDHGLLLSAESFLTRVHHVHRLKWLLTDPGSSDDQKALSGWLEKLAGIGAEFDRRNLQKYIAMGLGETTNTNLEISSEKWLEEQDAYNALSPTAREVAVTALRDLQHSLNDIPDESLASDWRYLCMQIRRDLLVEPATALAELDELRRSLLQTRRARTFLIGASTTKTGLIQPLESILAKLGSQPAPGAFVVDPDGLISSRIQARLGKPVDLQYVGLVNPSTQSGVFIHSAPLTGLEDTDRESILDYLAAQLYGGGGPHGLFMRTWGAGLAYSNGANASPFSGRINYYAERCPELPQTMSFVCSELENAKPGPELRDYVIAQSFGYYRSAGSYEERGEAIASDLVDGYDPETVAAFRRAILAVRDDRDLVSILHQRMPAVYGRVMPGYGVPTATQPEGLYMVIGPESQLSVYQGYLTRVEGASATLHRMYPRDFWIPAELDAEMGMR